MYIFLSLVTVFPSLSVTSYTTVYIPPLFASKSLDFTFMLDVKSPSSTSLAVIPSNILKLSLTFITVSSVFIVGFTLLVDNLGFTIIPWSDVFPFPLSLTCISNLLTPLTGTLISTILSLYLKILVVSKVSPSAITLKEILELSLAPIV